MASAVDDVEHAVDLLEARRDGTQHVRRAG
jgi:hypothetical protein